MTPSYLQFSHIERKVKSIFLKPTTLLGAGVGDHSNSLILRILPQKSSRTDMSLRSSISFYEMHDDWTVPVQLFLYIVFHLIAVG